jgi:hypothetical protein
VGSLLDLGGDLLEKALGLEDSLDFDLESLEHFFFSAEIMADVCVFLKKPICFFAVGYEVGHGSPIVIKGMENRLSGVG